MCQIRIKKTFNDRETDFKLSSFFAYHNLVLVNHLIPILKNRFPVSNILKDVKLGRTKTTSVIKNVIAKKESEDSAIILQQNFSSVLLDKSIDISANIPLCVNVKFVNSITLACGRLLKEKNVDGKNGNAENLYAAFKEYLISKNIQIKNIIGLACDNDSIMLGENNSFLTRLHAGAGALIVLPCICHSLALITSSVCSNLLRTPEEFVREVLLVTFPIVQKEQLKKCSNCQQQGDFQCSILHKEFWING